MYHNVDAKSAPQADVGAGDAALPVNESALTEKAKESSCSVKQLARHYALFVRGVLELPNPRYTALEKPWYVVVMLSVPMGLLLLGPLSLCLHRFGPLLPPASSWSSPWAYDLATLGLLVFYPLTPAFGLHYWLVFGNRYVRNLVLPNDQNQPRRVRGQLAGFLVSCYLLFWLMTSWHRLFSD